MGAEGTSPAAPVPPPSPSATAAPLPCAHPPAGPPSCPAPSLPRGLFSQVTEGRKNTTKTEIQRNSEMLLTPEGSSMCSQSIAQPKRDFPSPPPSPKGWKRTPICAFPSEHQACKLLFHAKKSFKEVSARRAVPALLLTGSGNVGYPPETECSRPLSHFFWHQCRFSG